MEKTNEIKTKKRYFPCWVCKGQGGWCDDRDDLGYCMSDIECGNCEGHGMIEINGKRHMEIKRESIALKAILLFKPTQEEWEWSEIQELGEKIQKLVEDPELLSITDNT